MMDGALGRSFSVERAWERLTLLLDTPGLSPQRLRQALLEELRQAFGARSAALAPVERGNPRWELLLSAGDPTDWRGWVQSLESDLSRPLPLTWHEDSRQTVVLMTLQVGGRVLAALMASGRDLYRPEPDDVDFDRLIQFLSLIEQGQRFRGLLEATQQKLEKLKADSERIALGNQRLFQELSSNQDRLRSISQGVLRVQENERSKISRELHDGLGQALTALKINIELLGGEVEDKLSVSGQDRLADTRSLASEAIEEVRELSRLLRPRMLDELGLSPTLSWYARTFGKRTGLKIEIEDDGQDDELGWEVETLIFRVTQEALNNIVKHSGSPVARVRLSTRGDAIQLQISDQGKGFNPTQLESGAPSGSGLPGIRDRVSLLGGTFSISSRPGEGAVLLIRIPRNETSLRSREGESRG